MKRKKFLMGIAAFLLAAAPIMTQDVKCPVLFFGEPNLPNKMKSQ